VIRIDILMCTFRRPEVIQALESLTRQIAPDGVELSIIVADNDTTDSAKDVVGSVANTSSIPIAYIHAPKQNISVARNACLDATSADWIVFTDDDEIAPNDWVKNLWVRATETSADAVFGPVKAIYPNDAPNWIVQLDLHSSLVAPKPGILKTLGRLGANFDFAEKAVVVEDVHPDRMNMKWLKRRRFRMGQSYVSSVTNRREKTALALMAILKLMFCFLRSALHILNPVKWRFWFLRGVLHCGVVAACLSVRDLKLY